MANDGTVKIAIEAITDGFESGLKKLGGVAKAALSGVTTAVAGVSAAAGAAAAGLLALESATEEYRIAQGKLNTAFEAANLSAEAAQEAYNGFYAILGDTDTATEASQLLATLVEDEKDISRWTKISAGVFGTFGDSLPIEGLIEASNETAKVGQVTGVLADALNWAGISEDEFNKKLEACSDESERNDLIMRTLAYTYDDAANAFYRNNEALIQARENQALLDSTLAQLGETVSKVKNNLISEFLPGIAAVVSAFNDLLNGAEGADEALSAAIGNLISGLVEKLPEFLSFGVDIIQSILSGLLENLPTLLDGLVLIVGQIFQALMELAPSLLEAGVSLLQYIASGLQQGIPELIAILPEIISSITSFFAENLPAIASAGAEIIRQLAQGISQGLPAIAEEIPKIIASAIDFLTEHLPEIAAFGVEIINSLVSGIVEAIPAFVSSLPQLIDSLTNFFVEYAPVILQSVVQIIKNLIDGIVAAIPELVAALPEIIDSIVGFLAEAVPQLLLTGAQLILALIGGIVSAIPDLVAALPQIIFAIADGLMSLLGGLADVGIAIAQAIWDGIVGGITSLLGIGGGGKFSKIGGKSARSAAAPMAISEGEEGGGISTYALSRASDIAALESAIPAAQSRVAIATAAMAPSAGYSAPPPVSSSGGGGNGQAPTIVVRPQVVIKAEGDLAPLAQLFKPALDAEDARVGQGVQ